MGGFKNPFGGGNIGSVDQITKGAGAVVGGGLAGIPGAISGIKVGGALGGADISIKDPAGMNQFTDLANQAQQEYGRQREFMGANVDPRRRQLLDQLALQAEGKGPSIAEAQLKSAFDKSLQQQLAMARSQRGNAGLASRNASNVAAQQAQNLAGQSAIARLQEQNMAQEGLQRAVNNEMQYGVGTLGAALGSQANVAAMQNAQRDRNDNRIGNIFNGIGSIAGSFLGMAEGGQVPSMKDYLASKSTKKYAYGGYVADVGNQGTQRMVQDTQGVLAAGEKNAGKGTALLSGGAKKLGANRLKAQDDEALNSMVDEFEAEDAQNAMTSFVPYMPAGANPLLIPGYAQGGKAMPYKSGGEVPGQAPVKGDSFKNDKVPAMLSPGEVVIPRSVIEQGAVAAGYFAKKASEDSNYNAKTFKSEGKSLSRMLKELQDSEETYKKVSSMLSSKKKVK